MTIKLALLIGINYYGTKSELRGCVNDVHAIRGLLTDVLGYESSNMASAKTEDGKAEAETEEEGAPASTPLEDGEDDEEEAEEEGASASTSTPLEDGEDEEEETEGEGASAPREPSPEVLRELNERMRLVQSQCGGPDVVSDGRARDLLRESGYDVVSAIMLHTDATYLDTAREAVQREFDALDEVQQHLRVMRAISKDKTCIANEKWDRLKQDSRAQAAAAAAAAADAAASVGGD